MISSCTYYLILHFYPYSALYHLLYCVVLLCFVDNNNNNDVNYWSFFIYLLPGPGDIFEGNTKLVMGLLWTLVRHYQIRSTGKALSTKQAMLTWINTLLPDQKVANFQSDWCDGRALCALVDRIQPGLCPHYATLKPSMALENCDMGMQLAEEYLEIPRIMEPENLSSITIDELSVMTYLSYFCKPALNRMLEWVQSKLADRNITNFKGDWNNGTNLACLIDSLSPGLFPTCRELDPHESLQNLTTAMQIAEDVLGVKPVIKPSEMADPNVDELNVLTYISRFQYAKAALQPNRCHASGPGLTRAFVGHQAWIRVNATKAGPGELDVTIIGSNRTQIVPEIDEVQKGIFKVTYVPTGSGALVVTIKWADVAIPGSSFDVTVFDTGAFTLTGPQITGGECVRLGNSVVMNAAGVEDIQALQILIHHENGAVTAAKVVSKGKGEAECSYTATKIGKDKIVVMMAGEEEAGSPFEVDVVDPTKYTVASLAPSTGKPVQLNKKATFVVNSSEAIVRGVTAEAKSPTQTVTVESSLQKDGSLLLSHAPAEMGNHSIFVTCAGENIRGSPLQFAVIDAAKCTFLDSTPTYLQIEKSTDLHISTRGAGPGNLQALSSNPTILSATVENSSTDLFSLSLLPHSLGTANIDVSWSGESVPPAPLTISVCDASKCSAYGPGLLSGVGKADEVFEFTVQAEDAGKGQLSVKPKGPKSVYAANVKSSDDGTYAVSFTTYEKGPHSIDITWGDVPIPGSPFSVDFFKGADATQFTATGDGLQSAVARCTAAFVLLGPDSGLLDSGVLDINISGNNMSLRKVSSGNLVSTSSEILLCTEDKGNGSYAVQYSLPQLGEYKISINCSSVPIAGSPFIVNALPAANASGCRAFGSALEHSNSHVVGRSLEFKVDTSNAGTGSISVSARNSLAQVLPVFQAEDTTSGNQHIYVFKLDPKIEGKLTVDLLWSGEHIPGSPFQFDVGDPHKCSIVSLPDPETFIAKVGESFQVAVDISKAGPGVLRAVAKHYDGQQEEFEMQGPDQNGVITSSYNPEAPGRIELLLTYSGVNILKSPWVVDAANPGLFQVTAPKGFGKLGDHVKFVISGFKKKSTKSLNCTAKHENHTAKVKVTHRDDGTAVAHFTAKMIGTYVVSVKCAGQHISGSPFNANIANPSGCKVSSAVPTELAIGSPVTIKVDTSEAGPGRLSCSIQQEANDAPYINYEVADCSSTIQEVILSPVNVGVCKLSLRWADYDVPGMPTAVSIADPKKCKFECPQLTGKSTVKQNEEVTVIINFLQCGSCSPRVIATGPKVTYTPECVDNENGTFTANFSPWQTGEHCLEVLIAGVSIPKTPLKFQVLKKINPTQITATGEGLQVALSNRPAFVTIFAQESGLLKQNAFTFKMTSELKEVAHPPQFNCSDNGNGTYRLTYTPNEKGNFDFHILYEDQPIAMSPFSVTVKPEPEASKCSASGRAIEPGVCLRVREAAEITVNTTKAGAGNLTVTGKQPDGALLRVFTTEEKLDDQNMHYLKFDSIKVGVYTININWDDEPIPGSPFQVRIVDPSRCQFIQDPPTSVQVGETTQFIVDCTGAGSGSFEILFDGNENSPLLHASIEAVDEVEESGVVKSRVLMSGTAIGKTQVSLKWGGYDIPQSPFNLSVFDATRCVVDAEEMLKQTLQVGVPFQFKINAASAGKANLKVSPAKSCDSEYTINIRDDSDQYIVECTPWTTGEQSLEVLWGSQTVPDTPLHFSVCDPKKCHIVGLPEPTNFVAIVGEPVAFSVEHSQAGPGELNVVAKLEDGTVEPLEMSSEGGHSKVMYCPRQSGCLEFLMQYSGVNLLSTPWVYEVPNPRHFKVVPPKGFGKLNEAVKFVITGVTKKTQNFSITATHPDHTASIITDHAKDEGTFIAYFTPQVTGEYLIQVQHSAINIDGSPFAVQVANPAGCKIISPPPPMVAVKKEATVIVDTSSAGPGELSCFVVNLSGELNLEPTVAPEDGNKKGQYLITFASENVGMCEIMLKWADHAIPDSTQTISFVDPSQVTYSCKELKENVPIKQGEPLVFNIMCQEAGHGKPIVAITGQRSQYPVEVMDNHDGSFTACVTPWQVGTHEVSISWGGFAVPGTPFNFEVHKIIDPRSITAVGDGLRFAIAQEQTEVTINTPESGLVSQGLLTVSCFNPKSEDQEERESASCKYEIEDIGDGTYRLTLTYPVEGSYVLSINYEDQPIYSSPFTVTVKGAPSADKCKLFGLGIDKMRNGNALLVNHPVEFSVDTTDAGNGTLSVIATDALGENVRVYTLDEEANGRTLHHLKFDPYEVGYYTVKLFWSKETIPDTPLQFSVIDPTRCLLNGLPLLNNGAIILGEEIQFSIEPGNSGEEKPVVSLTNRADDSILSTLIPSAISSGVYHYSSTAHEPGNYNINVSIGGVHVPFSPFKCDIVDPSQFAICGLNVTGKYALVCELVTFNIQGQPPPGEKFSVIAHGPLADLHCEVQGGEEESYRSSFVPMEPGSYEVFVECAGKHVPGSPFTVLVCDPSKCTLLGNTPSLLQVGSNEQIIIKTRGAGQGELNILVNGEKESALLEYQIKNPGLDTYNVLLSPKRVGQLELNLQWCGFNIPQSPLRLSICDASQCKVFGQALMSRKGKVGELITFTVVTHRAGVGKLTVKSAGPSAQYNVNIKETAENKHEVQFTPWEVGDHVVEVFWGKGQAPNSPYKLSISPATGTTICTATGEGLKRAIAGKPAVFTIVTSEIGLLQKDALKVAVVGVQAHAEVLLKDQNNGCYIVQYVPPLPGAYITTVTYHDKQIPGSPFKLNCVPGPDATKCRAYGAALHPNSLHVAGSPLEFKVDSSEAGFGHLRVYIQGPNDYHPKVYIADEGQGNHSVKFDAMTAGRYFIVVAWAEKHIPGSPFKLRVHPAADASKVKAYGPGLQDGFLGDTGQFKIETKNAGIGTLLFRVHGIKDTFKIEATSDGEEDRRTLVANYSPTTVGEYVIFIRWSGVHIPGSPFTVNIRKKKKEGEEEEKEITEKPSIHQASQATSSDKKPLVQSETAPTASASTEHTKKGMFRRSSGESETHPRRKRATTSPEGPISSSFLQSAPVYQAHLERSASEHSNLSKTEKKMLRSRSGPVAPKMKMKTNPSFGSLPPYAQGYLYTTMMLK